MTLRSSFWRVGKKSDWVLDIRVRLDLAYTIAVVWGILKRGGVMMVNGRFIRKLRREAILMWSHLWFLHIWKPGDTRNGL